LLLRSSEIKPLFIDLTPTPTHCVVCTPNFRIVVTPLLYNTPPLGAPQPLSRTIDTRSRRGQRHCASTCPFARARAHTYFDHARHHSHVATIHMFATNQYVRLPACLPTCLLLPTYLAAYLPTTYLPTVYLPGFGDDRTNSFQRVDTDTRTK